MYRTFLVQIGLQNTLQIRGTSEDWVTLGVKIVIYYKFLRKEVLKFQ